jgi:hypothetical protein
MSDLNAPTGMKLGDALRALPLAAPERDAWPALAARLTPAVSRRRRYALPLAVAAACVLAIIAATALNRSLRPARAPQIAATVVGANTSSTVNGANGTDAANVTNTTSTQSQEGTDMQLTAAQMRSQALERWLRDTRFAASPLPSQDLAAATEIEDLIGMVDIELASAQTSSLPLWQRRVALLEDLTTLRYSNYRLAETASTAAAAGALNRIN